MMIEKYMDYYYHYLEVFTPTETNPTDLYRYLIPYFLMKRISWKLPVSAVSNCLEVYIHCYYILAYEVGQTSKL